MGTNEIDWRKAPKWATHYCTSTGAWYRVTVSNVFFWREKANEWEESLMLLAEEIDKDSSFVKIPVKPPLGLMPKNLWLEGVNNTRKQDIRAALLRYLQEDRDIPTEWLYELADYEKFKTENEHVD